MKRYIVIKSEEVLLTVANGIDFRTKKGDIIEIEDGEVYWKPVDYFDRVLTNMRIDYIMHLLENKHIEKDK